jgi:Mg2+-importing ATPase
LSRRLGIGEVGLTRQEARDRLARQGAGRLRPRRAGWLALLLGQFRGPIVLILLGAAALAFALGQRSDASIILAIVLGSSLLGFWQEHGASGAVEALLARVRIRAAVVRDGVEAEVPVEEVVPGDLVALRAGDIVPGDCRVLESRDLFVDEAALTGETYPVEKAPGIVAAETGPAGRKNSLFLGTHIVSGTARAVVVLTGAETEFGRVSRRMNLGRPETDFERGVRRFGYLLMEVTLILVVLIFAVNVFLGRPVLDSFLFAMALAVGLTPQLLPAIISVNLAHGARRMARRRVIVKRLASIENFGSMDTLCSDKTGTLTEGVVRLRDAIDVEGQPSDRVRLLAGVNALFESGFANPIDAAIRAQTPPGLDRFRKLDEVPYDFLRKRLSVAAAEGDRNFMITKGALPNVLEVCSHAELDGGRLVGLDEVRPRIDERYEQLGSEGFRVLGVAYRDLGHEAAISKESEREMTFLGFLVLHDPPKADSGETVRRLRALGIAPKVVTGDNRLVAATVARAVGLDGGALLTGPEIRRMSDDALVRRAPDVGVFAEVEPTQKERILLALRRAGCVVGYVGDGINDAPALRAADVGISVDGAVDVAKEAADVVLLEKDLGVLAEGVEEGRRTFANTLKYVYVATSANFGNMFSMAGASLFLPFLPLLPKQILLTNLLTDLPEMTIATDDVDPELVERPRRWDIRSIRDFMIVFGAISSLFDYATFGVLLWVLRASREQFRTGWFVESVISAAMIVLVVRTRGAFYARRPGRALLASTIAVAVATLLLPYTPLAPPLGFRPVPARFLPGLALILAGYVATAELAKRLYFRAESRPGRQPPGASRAPIGTRR